MEPRRVSASAGLVSMSCSILASSRQVVSRQDVRKAIARTDRYRTLRTVLWLCMNMSLIRKALCVTGFYKGNLF